MGKELKALQEELALQFDTTYYNQPLIIRERDIRRIGHFLESHFEKVEYTANRVDNFACLDNNPIVTDSLDVLLNYDNPFFHRITQIRFFASISKPVRQEVELLIGPGGIFPNNTAELTTRYADRNWANKVKYEITERLNELRPWHTWLSKVPFIVALPAMLFLLSFVVVGITAIQKMFIGNAPNTSSTSSRLTEGEATVFAYLVVAILFLFGFIIDRFKSYLFPRFFFALGRQCENYERRQKFAYWLFVGIFLTLGLGVISNYLFNFLGLGR